MAPASGARPGRLHGKVALVSGAAHGLGASIAEAFAREGARVFVGDVDAAGVRALAARLQMPGLVLDVREEMAWIAAIAQVLDASGRLDVLVNCARITAIEPDDASARARRHDPEHAALADWQAVYRTNLDGVFLGCKHAIRAMRRGRRGAILNLSPTGGTADAGATPAHGSSQAAVCSHTQSLAAYCLQQGLAIRCHALLPATTAVAAADVASLAVFLASDESAGITGAEIRLDGCRFVPPAA